MQINLDNISLTCLFTIDDDDNDDDNNLRILYK